MMKNVSDVFLISVVGACTTSQQVKYGLDIHSKQQKWVALDDLLNTICHGLFAKHLPHDGTKLSVDINS